MKRQKGVTRKQNSVWKYFSVSRDGGWWIIYACDTRRQIYTRREYTEITWRVLSWLKGDFSHDVLKNCLFNLFRSFSREKDVKMLSRALIWTGATEVPFRKMSCIITHVVGEPDDVYIDKLHKKPKAVALRVWNKQIFFHVFYFITLNTELPNALWTFNTSQSKAPMHQEPAVCRRCLRSLDWRRRFLQPASFLALASCWRSFSRLHRYDSDQDWKCEHERAAQRRCLNLSDEPRRRFERLLGMANFETLVDILFAIRWSWCWFQRGLVGCWRNRSARFGSEVVRIECDARWSSLGRVGSGM